MLNLPCINPLKKNSSGIDTPKKYIKNHFKSSLLGNRGEKVIISPIFISPTKKKKIAQRKAKKTRQKTKNKKSLFILMFIPRI
jgi:hypothetical protein